MISCRIWKAPFLWSWPPHWGPAAPTTISLAPRTLKNAGLCTAACHEAPSPKWKTNSWGLPPAPYLGFGFRSHKSKPPAKKITTRGLHSNDVPKLHLQNHSKARSFPIFISCLVLGSFQPQRQRPGDPRHPEVAVPPGSPGGAVGSRAPRTAAAARSPGCRPRRRRPRRGTALGRGPPAVVPTPFLGSP